MITVGIFINNELILRKSAHRVKETDENGEATYKISDENKFIKHNPKDGPVKLSQKLLDNLDEEKEKMKERNRLIQEILNK